MDERKVVFKHIKTAQNENKVGLLPNMGLQVWLITSKQTDPDLKWKRDEFEHFINIQQGFSYYITINWMTQLKLYNDISIRRSKFKPIDITPFWLGILVIKNFPKVSYLDNISIAYLIGVVIMLQTIEKLEGVNSLVNCLVSPFVQLDFLRNKMESYSPFNANSDNLWKCKSYPKL